LNDKTRGLFLDGPWRREAAGVRLPPNRYAHATLRAILTNETGWTTHYILRIASWIAKIGGSIKRKIPLRGIVAVIWDADRSVRFRVEITVRTLSHQWSSCRNGPAEKAGRDGTFCYCPHGGIPRHNAHPWAGTLTQRHARLIKTQIQGVESVWPRPSFGGWGAIEWSGRGLAHRKSACPIDNPQEAIAVPQCDVNFAHH
jgi:hypothetical protein